jgi:RNA polymerase sigma-70 factor (ECF subfamily)
MATPPRRAVDALELEKHRPQLLKFAMLQLRNATAAEDAVQETLLAAVQSAESFAGQSSVKTWLVGILKHKIIDAIRRSSREQPLRVGDEETSAEDLAGLFKDDGHLQDPPADWGDPDAALTQRKFFEALERCMERLPRNTARAFALREVMGLETDEICKELGVTPSNCWVLLYRARMGLRECLEQGWFGAAAPGRS